MCNKVDISYIEDRYDKERWIKGYEGIYSVDIEGVVRKYVDVPNMGLAGSKEMKPYTKNKHGFLTIGLNKEGITTIHYLHKLVAKTFLDNPYNQSKIIFNDGDKTNCCLSNLSYSQTTGILPSGCTWIEGYEGLYYENIEKRVFNSKHHPLKVNQQNGYSYVILYKNTKKYRKYVLYY